MSLPVTESGIKTQKRCSTDDDDSCLRKQRRIKEENTYFRKIQYAAFSACRVWDVLWVESFLPLSWRRRRESESEEHAVYPNSNFSVLHFWPSVHFHMNVYIFYWACQAQPDIGRLESTFTDVAVWTQVLALAGICCDHLNLKFP